MSAYQPKAGERCSCKRGMERDNCPACEGTGWRIDFAKIRAKAKEHKCICPGCGNEHEVADSEE